VLKLEPDFVIKAMKAELQGGPLPRYFAGLSTDTRSIAPGQLFIALKGDNFDGHDFVAQALAAGSPAAIVEKGFELPDKPGAILLKVPDTLTALGDLAAAWRRKHPVPLFAITGSNGKTTTKEMLASILSRKANILKSQGNFNNLVGLPLTLLQLDSRHEAVVAEMGMNHTGEIARLTEIAAPDVGVVTNVGPAHIGLLGSMEAIAAAKGELYDGLKKDAIAVLNIEDPYLARLEYKINCQVVSFGFSQDPHVLGRDLSALGSRQAFNLKLPDFHLTRVRLAMAGRHNVMNALAAAACAWSMGMDADTIKVGLESYHTLKGRLVKLRSMWGYTIIDDTYNANPYSVVAGLSALKDMAGSRRKALILGDMMELGDHAARLHRECGQRAAEMGCQVVLALGRYAKHVAEGALEGGLPPANVQAFEDFWELIEACHTVLIDGDVVLVKGSRLLRMERVVAALTTGEID
jgi:UDP-N-acetylmuramoyl-tripeptide--D-alanyl-D-alanine ligase